LNPKCECVESVGLGGSNVQSSTFIVASVLMLGLGTRELGIGVCKSSILVDVIQAM